MWHLGGGVGAGMSIKDTALIQHAIGLVAESAGKKLDKNGDVEDIQDDLSRVTRDRISEGEDL
ncbi:MAG: hypothetical protein M1827_000998 [Pycnora praestabilis]|nr:MAG: hypothetical protein M1827_000998 [Pycnora praestabilis]